MRYWETIIGGFVLLLVACQTNWTTTEGNSERFTKDSVLIASKRVPNREMTEKYGNDSVQFLVYLDNVFELVERTRGEVHILEGNLNYERGFEDDIDATLYILDFDKLGSERYYVRFTHRDSILIPLNQERGRTDDPVLYREKKE